MGNLTKTKIDSCPITQAAIDYADSISKYRRDSWKIAFDGYIAGYNSLDLQIKKRNNLLLKKYNSLFKGINIFIIGIVLIVSSCGNNHNGDTIDNLSCEKMKDSIQTLNYKKDSLETLILSKSNIINYLLSINHQLQLDNIELIKENNNE